MKGDGKSSNKKCESEKLTTHECCCDSYPCQ